jgi:branched-chain amino acid transport system substrate-binding protein
VVKSKFVACVLALLGVTGPAVAQEPVKIGFITTLSGPGGYLGQDIRDAFQLAINAEGGKLGGVPVQLVVEDDGLKPGQAKQIAERMMKTDGIKLFTGTVFSNVASAVVPDIVDNGALFVSPNAGPSNLAGKECHKNYFVMSWLTDTMQGSAGQNATALGYKRAFVLAPNYTAGKDAIEGFKRFFKGQIIGEVYTRLDSRGQAGRGVSLSSRRSRHRLHAPVSAGRIGRDHSDGSGGAVDGSRAAEDHRRGLARH